MLNETHRPRVSFFFYEVAITGRKRFGASLARLPFSFNHLLALTDFADKATVGRVGEGKYLNYLSISRARAPSQSE